jgi:hypothetical protein
MRHQHGSSGFVTTCVRVLLICKCGCSIFYTNVTFVESHIEITIDGLCGCSVTRVTLVLREIIRTSYVRDVQMLISEYPW